MQPSSSGVAYEEGEGTITSGVTLVTLSDQIEYAVLTDVGVRRSHNQDNCIAQTANDAEHFQQHGHLYVVADGMGAHAVGEKASEQAVHVIPHTYNKYAHEGPIAALRKAFVEANASIHACGQANREFHGMGTTGTALLIRSDAAWVGHVGDSRAYRIRDGLIEQLTYDHSLVWEYARREKIDPSQVQDIPSNVIIRCLGPEPLVQVDVEGPHALRPGDIFLLCSDGLSGQVNDSEIGAVASELPPEEACRFLVDLANMRGGPDNITVMIIRLQKADPHSNGVPVPWSPSSPSPLMRLPPWWLLTLLVGTILIFLAIALRIRNWPAIGMVLFLLAACAIVAGLVGLGLHYRREQKQQEETDGGPTLPRIHRTAGCRVEQAMLDKVIRTVKALRLRAGERQWDFDQTYFDEHYTQAETLLAKGDIPGAFREYCRAMMPLSQALNKQRNKEEIFQPLWDKTR
jgi:PPM family protein phosphatase